ncbi:MAG: TetR/AcrR family transcriptional regulator [Actinomycetota bacterium]|nr:TetR/AcrR family transcriptional regulator [Actinomycetota bacterium]
MTPTKGDRPTNKRMTGEARRLDILTTALTTFAQTGYHSTSMNEIAAAAGVTKPVIYQHFDSKRHLYRQLIVQEGRRLIDQIATATAPSESGHQQVVSGFASYFRFAFENRSSYDLLFGSEARLEDDFKDAIADIEDEIAELVTNRIQIDADAHYRRVLAMGIIYMIEGSVRTWRNSWNDENQIGSFEQSGGMELASQLADLAWYGLRGVGSTPLLQ